MNERKGAIKVNLERLLRNEALKSIAEIQDGKFHIKKPSTAKIYDEMNRMLGIGGKRLHEHYEGKYGEDSWVKKNETVKVNTDELIKEKLGVGDDALMKFKNGYIQDVGNFGSLPFSCMSTVGLGVKKEQIQNLYKTNTGDIGIQTRMKIAGVNNINNGTEYSIQCEIESILEQNTTGHYELKYMWISGRDKELVEQLFMGNYVTVKGEEGTNDRIVTGYLPDFLKKRFETPITNPQKFIETICQGEHAKASLLSAAREHSVIYKEMVEPKITPLYIWRTIREFFNAVEPLSKFTPQEHLALIAKHPDLLNDGRPNNPYQAILNKINPEEKLSFLCREAIGSPQNICEWDKSFFQGLDQKLSDIVRQGKDNPSTQRIYQDLKVLLSSDDPEVVKRIETELPKLCVQCLRIWPDSPVFINYWLNVVSDRTDGRLATSIGFNLHKGIQALAEKGFTNPVMNEADKTAIESILKTINKHDYLSEMYKEQIPGLEKLLTPQNSSDNEQAKKINEKVRDANELTKQNIDRADETVKKLEGKVNEEKIVESERKKLGLNQAPKPPAIEF